MNTLIEKTTNAVSSMALFAIGLVVAGLGLAVATGLALFALTMVCLAFVASPFIALAQSPAPQAKEETEDKAETAAA